MPMPSAGCAPATSQRRSWVPVAACPSGLGDTHTQVIAAAGQVQQEMARLFAQWAQSGQLPADRGTPEELAWELFAPSAFARLLYLHAEAAPATRRAGHQLLRRHLEFFIATVLATPAHHPDPGVPGQG